MNVVMSDIVIEVTRRCNMACKHCLRGEAENLDISHETIDNVLTPLIGGTIGGITFTGGEPSLNVDAIRYTLDFCREHDIGVSHFYIVTNGKEVKPEFLQVCLDWYLFCMEYDEYEAAEMCGLCCSTDRYHEPVSDRNRMLLNAFAFSRPGDHTMSDSTFLINEGRATAISTPCKRELDIPALEDICEYNEDPESLWFSEVVSFSANGDIRTTCDTAFNDSRATVGNVNGDTPWPSQLLRLLMSQEAAC